MWLAGENPRVSRMPVCHNINLNGQVTRVTNAAGCSREQDSMSPHPVLQGMVCKATCFSAFSSRF